MKTVILFALVMAAVLARPEGDIDFSKLENLDIDTLVENERLLKGYALCLLGKGNCTPEGKSIKKAVPDAVENVCAKCSPKSKPMIRKMMIAFKEKLPAEWEELLKTYDADKKHGDDLNKFLAETD